MSSLYQITPAPDNGWQDIVSKFRAYLATMRGNIARPAPMIVDKPSRGRKRKPAAAEDKAYQARHIHLLKAGAARPALVDSWQPRKRAGLWSISGSDVLDRAA